MIIFEDNIDYIGILKYLEKNQSISYSKPEKEGISAEKKEQMLNLKEEGHNVIEEMKKIGKQAENLYDLSECLPSSWLDGSNIKTKKYLWTQIRYSSYRLNPISISIFVERENQDKAYFRISLEIKNNTAKKEEIEQYYRYFEIPLKAGLVYVAGSNEKENPKLLEEPQNIIMSKLKSGEYEKVQICKYIKQQEGKSNLEYHQEIMEAIGEILPYYDHVLGRDKLSEKKGWLLIWNPENWPWEKYEECCEGTKKGETYTISWTCKSKQPRLGDDVFLMKTGKSLKGIIAHGLVVKEPYEGIHYNLDKAKEGKTANHIDVEYDQIQKLDPEEILLQDYLKENYSQQNWSPMASGIEIRESTLKNLREDWKKLLNKNNNFASKTAKGEIKEMVNYPKNLILYGPPGTGKTYNSIIYAVAICDKLDIDIVKSWNYNAVMDRYNELKKGGQIIFTTFHQSYGYEEFIEGIKPIVDEDKKEIGYKIEPGIFKRFCDVASTKEIKTDSFEINSQPSIWKVTIRQLVKQDCFDNNRVRIDWDINSEGANNFVNDINKGDIILTTDGSRSIISGIAIVTSDEAYKLKGENDTTTRDVKWLAKDLQEDIKELNSGRLLHRKTCARVPGMSTSSIIELAKNKNTDLLNTNIIKNNKNYVFIIDEINRGNISKIFGELITLIEDTKRAGMCEEASAILPYSGQSFSVPSNVYILGTMNTADRSIALMDTALRRRFEFIEMMPDVNILRAIGANMVEDLDVAEMLEKINERITFLYDREHTIGHAFFTKLAENATIDTLKSIFEKSVIPLLQEYFYEDYYKIQLILGDNGKSVDTHKFILDTDIKVREIFKENVDVDLPEKKYSINLEAFSNIDSYKEII